jgi:hypothetical protein
MKVNRLNLQAALGILLVALMAREREEPWKGSY